MWCPERVSDFPRWFYVISGTLTWHGKPSAWSPSNSLPPKDSKDGEMQSQCDEMKTPRCQKGWQNFLIFLSQRSGANARGLTGKVVGERPQRRGVRESGPGGAAARKYRTVGRNIWELEIQACIVCGDEVHRSLRLVTQNWDSDLKTWVQGNHEAPTH